MSKIYHYTTIENLALILKNRTIRFNRLDRMDDPCEHRTYSFNMDWSPYTYVSCWTESSVESIPLWHMYSKGGVGVRIAIDKDCIAWDKIIPIGFMQLPEQEDYPPEKKGQKMVGVKFHPFSIVSSLSTKDCYCKMNYVDKAIYDFPVKIGVNRILIEKSLTKEDFRNYIGLYKDNKWDFQNEFRFRIFMMPIQPDENEDLLDIFFNTIKERIYNPFKFIDFPLKDECLNNIEILVGPNAAESHFLILEALRDRYLPSIKIEARELNSENWFFEPRNNKWSL